MFQLQTYLTDHLDHYQTAKAGRYNHQRLLAMDDRSLTDIGVTRGDLIYKVRKQPSPAKLRAKALKVERKAHKAAIAELHALTDADLNDLGITRGNIAEVVRYGRGGLVEQPMSANAARKATRGEQARAARELASMNDAQLEDIGIIRGDINDLVRHGRKAAKGQTLPRLAKGLVSVFKGPVVVSQRNAAAANTNNAPKPPRNPVSNTVAA
ncbi:MAG: DUF1127 domain-containing protein [Granulosicoccaceae bacterium]